MNRLILKYAYPITVVILAIFAWVIFSRIAQGGLRNILVLAIAAVVVWVIGAFLFIYLWPAITIRGFKSAITRRGFSGGPVPVNTLYAEPNISSASSTDSILGTGTDDVLYVAGWLDLRAGPQILHVPDTNGRYYSLQLTDPSTSANFAYVGKRATGTKAGDFLLVPSNWRGATPDGMTRIETPHNSALIIGRVFTDGERDQSTAYALAQQIGLTPLQR
jgi:hypothetical protein